MDNRPKICTLRLLCALLNKLTPKKIKLNIKHAYNYRYGKLIKPN